MTSIELSTRFFGERLEADIAERLPAAESALCGIREKTCPGAEWTGWFDYPSSRGRRDVEHITAFKKQLPIAYDTVVVIGIGGSYLGARAVYEGLRHEFEGLVSSDKNKLPMIFLGHHLSESSLIETLDMLESCHPIVNVISKSGTTTEPGVAFRILRSYLEKRFGKEEARTRIVATTDAASGALRKLAEEEGYKTFVVPSDVGGRYSVLTPVGLVPLALAGYDVEELVAGADGLFGSLQQCGSEHPVLRYAAARYAAYAMGKRIDLLSYGEPKFAYIAEWWKQLFGESEGKQGKGLFPASLCYTTDLHSLGQYVQDGERNLIETFVVIDNVPAQGGTAERRLRLPRASGNLDELAYLEGRYIADINDAALQATKVAHYDGGVPCMELRLATWGERQIGELFAFFETACGVSAALLGVNPYDQPGVEAYKKNLFGLLGKPGFEAEGAELRQRVGDH